ncbi:MarR family transcriptional regulator [Halopiger goleimassiliensis]|uniref:MarR family transcriptional regulator n=1 Tax=Halopiger goleimassiliensis TaxID=1293048 RepID=UPI000677C759|nr:MarR family transcriptional regulator [Halopiger goleimassiliensis]
MPEKQEDHEDLPPSAQFVLWVLEDEGPLTQQELAEKITLPKRTVRYALTRLEDEGIVESQTYLKDARQSLYTIEDDTSGR